MAPACFICGGEDFVASAAAYRRCRRCGHETLQTAGAAQTYMLNEPLDAAATARASRLDRFQAAILDHYTRGRPRGMLVDIGSGSGRFLHRNHRKFDRHCGIEITPAAVAFARDTLGLRIATDLRQVDGAIDVATAWHSLEHFPAPALGELLEQLSAKLTPGGCVIVSVPNAASFQSRLYGAHAAFHDVPNHLQQFTPESLDRLFGRHGLTRTRTAVSWTYNLFGQVQGLLNLVQREHNYLYYRLKRGRASSPRRDLANLLLLPFVALPALVLAALEAAVPSRQGVLTCCFEKRGSEP